LPRVFQSQAMHGESGSARNHPGIPVATSNSQLSLMSSTKKPSPMVSTLPHRLFYLLPGGSNESEV
jgi:hypothetical protein